MKSVYLSLVVLLGLAAWKVEVTQSALIPSSLGQHGKAQPTLKEIEGALEDYVELAEAYYAPAPNDTVREKRTLAVFRTIANTTRAGIATVTSLFRSGSGGSGSGSGGFRAFFSDLFTRILTFFTRLWDRITGLFNGGGSSGGGGGIFARLQSGVSGLFGRLSGGGGGGSGGGLFSLFGRTTTTEASFYPDFVYTTEKTTSTTTTTEQAPIFGENEADNDFLSSGTDTKVADAEGQREPKGYDTAATSDSDSQGGYSDFIPFPGDSEIGVRSGAGSPTAAEKALRGYRDTKASAPAAA